MPLLQQLSFANHFTLHFTSISLSFTLERRLLSAHDATHSYYGGSAIDLQFCCPFDKGKKGALPLALVYLCSSHCAIFMSSLRVSEVSFLKHFVPQSMWLFASDRRSTASSSVNLTTVGTRANRSLYCWASFI